MLFSEAWGKMSHEKNPKQKISCPCPLKKKTFTVTSKTLGYGNNYMYRIQQDGTEGEWEGKLHCKKRFVIFPSPAGMSFTKLSLDGNNLIIPVQGEFGKWHPGWGRENR